MTQKIKAGWYPDPSTNGRQQRYWDGSDWTDEVQPYAGPSDKGTSAKPSKRSKGGWRLGVPLTFLIAAVVVGYAIVRNQDVESVEVGDGGLKVSFLGTRSLSSSEVEAKQSELEERLQSLEDRAKTAGPTTTPTTVNLTGDWIGANGMTYRIQQYGAQAVISEISPYGITAVGEGFVEGNFVRFAFQAADGSTGQADLQLVNPNRLTGTFTNFAYGITTPARMTR